LLLLLLLLCLRWLLLCLRRLRLPELLLLRRRLPWS